MINGLVRLAEILGARYQAVQTDHAIQSEAWSSAFIAHITALLEHTLRICVYFTDPFECWKEGAATAPRPSPFEGKKQLAELFVGILSHLGSRPSRLLLEAERSLLDQLLGAIASLVHGNSEMQLAWASVGGINTLLKFLGWPNGWRRASMPDAAHAEEEEHATLMDEREFLLQFRCLQVLRAASCKQSHIIRSIVRVNGCEKISEFILWAFLRFSVDSSDVPSAVDELEAAIASHDEPLHGRPPLFSVINGVKQLQLVFDLLLSVCLLPQPKDFVLLGEEKHEDADPQSNLDCQVVSMVLGLFSQKQSGSPYNSLARRRFHFNTVAGQYVIRLPLLQQHALNFLHRLLGEKPELIELCRSRDLYHTLFSQEFFFLGEKMPEVSEDGVPAEISERDKVVFSDTCHLLRLEVLELVQFLATRDGSLNTEECRYLMAVLAQRIDEHESCAMVSRCALAILRMKRIQTQGCLLKADAPQTLYRVIKRQQELQSCIDPSSTEYPLFMQARLDILNLLSQFLSSPDIKMRVLRDRSTVQVIFALIQEPLPMRRFGIDIITGDEPLCTHTHGRSYESTHQRPRFWTSEIYWKRCGHYSVIES